MLDIKDGGHATLVIGHTPPNSCSVWLATMAKVTGGQTTRSHTTAHSLITTMALAAVTGAAARRTTAMTRVSPHCRSYHCIFSKSRNFPKISLVIQQQQQLLTAPTTAHVQNNNNRINDFASFHRRYFSSSSSSSSSSNNDSPPPSDDFMLFYQRNPARNVAHQGFFGISIFNTTYWTWYTLDFVPAVNSSPIQDLHIDPRLGWGGIALGFMINALTVLYPLSSISRLGYSQSQRKWYLWGHSLPLLGPSTGPPKEFALGDVSMDRTSADTKKILNSGISSYVGHLGIFIKGSKYPYLMEIKDNSTELPGDTDLMLQALLNPGALLNTHHKQQHIKLSPSKENTMKHRRKRKK